MNYIGSKRSLLDFLLDSIGRFTGYGDKGGYSFADLFAGTGVVGAAFRQNGCIVASCDIQYYSYVLNRHRIESDGKVPARAVEYLSSLPEEEGFIYKNYCPGSGSGRNYFTDSNGRKCDTVRLGIERLYRSGQIGEDAYFTLLASLIDSIDRYANTASVYGAFLKHTKKSARREFKLNILPPVHGPRGKVYNEDISRVIKKVSGDVLYLDPPYNDRQYAANYHLLETVAKYDNPAIHGKTGIRDYRGQKSLFCSKKTVAGALEEVIKNADFRFIFLSYNDEGLLSPRQTEEIMSGYGKYTRFERQYKRFVADREDSRRILGETTVEYLHCIEKA